MDNMRFDKVINLAARDTKKGARIVAKVFYRILRKKGFTENQIIDIATNILNCLTESLKGYEKKVEIIKEKQEESTGNIKHGKETLRTFTKINRRYDNYENGLYGPNL